MYIRRSKLERKISLGEIEVVTDEKRNFITVDIIAPVSGKRSKGIFLGIIND